MFARGKQKGLKTLDSRELLFISLSGIATGASWLCYYYAIAKGLVSVVVPILTVETVCVCSLPL